MTRSCYIFDLDGTLADRRHRLHFIQGERKDWRAFFAACGKDTVIEPIAELYNAVKYSTSTSYTGSNMVIMSGRSDECRWITEDWLERMGLECHALYMRKAGDYRPDHVVKRKMLEQVIEDGWKPVLFVDDRQQVVEMWRSLGYTVLQCAKGDF